MSEDDAKKVILVNPDIKHRSNYIYLVMAVICIAVLLVGVSLALYASSGAAQLDLSRPGYVSVRDQVLRSDDFDGFSSSGVIDEETIKEFRKLYEEQSKKATSVNSFSGNVMSDEALMINE